MGSTRLIGNKPDQVQTNGRLGKLSHMDSDAPVVGPEKILQAAPTLASATTIAPTKRNSFVSGTTTIATITPTHNILATGGRLTLIPLGVFATNTSGNIALATTAVVGRHLDMVWDAGTGKWYPSY